MKEEISRAVMASKEEMERRIAKDNMERTAHRIQKGYAKRGPKHK
jgi:hypothetical protein